VDPIILLLQVAFYLLFAMAVWRYAHRRHVVEGWVVLVFATTATLFALSIVGTISPAARDVVRPLALGTFLAQPYLIVRLLGSILPTPAWVGPATLAALALTSAMLVVLGTGNAVAITAIVLYFGVVELGAALQFVRLARQRRGPHRARLAMAGLATALFALAVVVAGIGSAASGGGGVAPVLTAVSRSFALVAALGYLAAFAPPRWLTGFFHRAAAFDLGHAVVDRPAGAATDGLWVQLAEAAESILGAREVEIVEEAGGARVHPSQGTVIADGSLRPSAPGDPDDQTTIPITLDGERVATLRARLEGRPLFLDDDVRTVALLGSSIAQSVRHAQAATRLREAELALEASSALRESEARFRVFLEADPNAIIATDENGRITWSTRSSADLFGYDPDGLVGLPLGELVDVPPVDDVAGRHPGEVVRLDSMGRRRDGTTLPVEVALRRFELDGRPTTLAVIADATWRQEANAIRDRFVGILSHELRTPITSIYGGSQVLLKRGMDLDHDTRTDLLTGLADESERLQRIIENLLILARVERGADFFGPGPVLVQRVIADVIERERAINPAATIRLTTDDGLPVVSGDDDQIAQVMRNLLANAIKFAGDDASIDVEVRREDGGVRVTVRDDGPGISPDEADQLFDLYFRSAGSDVIPGAGIGLYVCRHLVEAMGGSISARRAGRGGAEFSFTLKTYLDPADDGAGPGPSGAPVRSSAAHPRDARTTSRVEAGGA
jgi:PAS domain S-box-containing protein